MQKEVTAKVGPVGLQGESPIPIQGLTSVRIETGMNGAEQAFKSHVDKMAFRQNGSDNKLMGLGGLIPPENKGKRSDNENINCKPTKTGDLYQVV